MRSSLAVVVFFIVKSESKRLPIPNSHISSSCSMWGEVHITLLLHLLFLVFFYMSRACSLAPLSLALSLSRSLALSLSHSLLCNEHLFMAVQAKSSQNMFYFVPFQLLSFSSLFPTIFNFHNSLWQSLYISFCYHLISSLGIFHSNLLTQFHIFLLSFCVTVCPCLLPPVTVYSVVADDSRPLGYPASASSNQFSDVNSTESESVASTAEHSHTAKRKSTRGCRARGRGRGGSNRGSRKTVVLGKKSTTSLLVVAAKKAKQELNVAKILKKRKKKKKVYTMRKQHTTGMKCIRRKPGKKEQNKDSAQSSACQESSVNDTPDVPQTEPSIPVVDPKPSEAPEKASVEEVTIKKVKRKYHRRTNNSSQSSVASIDGSETDTSSVARSEILFTDTSVVNPKLGEPAERTTVEAPAVVPKKVKRKYVRKAISSKLSVSQGGPQSETSGVARTEALLTANTDNKPSGAVDGTSEGKAAVKPKRKYNWRMLSKKLAEGKVAKTAGKLSGEYSRLAVLCHIS